VWFCDLASLSEPDAVAHQVAAVVGAAPPRGGSVLDSVVDALRPADGVVVLDNCEHVLGAAGELVHRVVETCERVTVLATSRAPLGLAGGTPASVGSARPGSDPIHRSRRR